MENFLTETINHFNISEEVVNDSLVVKAGHQRKVEEQVQRYGKDGPIKVEIYFDARNGKELMVVNKIMKKVTDAPIRIGQ